MVPQPPALALRSTRSLPSQSYAFVSRRPPSTQRSPEHPTAHDLPTPHLSATFSPFRASKHRLDDEVNEGLPWVRQLRTRVDTSGVEVPWIKDVRSKLSIQAGSSREKATREGENAREERWGVRNGERARARGTATSWDPARGMQGIGKGSVGASKEGERRLSRRSQGRLDSEENAPPSSGLPLDPTSFQSPSHLALDSTTSFDPPRSAKHPGKHDIRRATATFPSATSLQPLPPLWHFPPPSRTSLPSPCQVATHSLLVPRTSSLSIHLSSYSLRLPTHSLLSTPTLVSPTSEHHPPRASRSLSHLASRIRWPGRFDESEWRKRRCSVSWAGLRELE